MTRRGPATLSWLLIAFAVVWVAIKAFGQGFGVAGNGPQFVITALNGMSLAALYFVTASGFTLIFGLMRVVNMARAPCFYRVGCDRAGMSRRLLRSHLWMPRSSASARRPLRASRRAVRAYGVPRTAAPTRRL